MSYLVFNWDSFTKSMFENAICKIKNKSMEDEFIGCIRVGDICFDVVLRELDGHYFLDYDCYIGGVDTGYGYSEDGYPYDYADGGCFYEYIDMDYDTFKKYAILELESYIKENNSLVEKANQKLNIW